mmetsp:Transcript_3490/g.7656  ORF Transcript_3490/g.7656 Transcript_3490/m.7656 type:complete len:311 (+) Transcript_3490:221-1153(+)
MGKKSKKTTATEESDLPQWHSALPTATIETVSELPQVDHGWIGTIIHADKRKHKHGILAILDITNRVRGEGMEARYMNIGPCPNPTKRADDIAKALLATMIKPQPVRGNDDPEYYAPRRPAWILMEKELQPALKVVQGQLSQVNVVVKLNTPEALAAEDDDTGTNHHNEAEDSRGRMATWEAGLAIGATAENVLNLPQTKNEIWKCSMTMLQEESTNQKECFFAIENITNGSEEENSYPLGVGPCPAATLNPDGMIRALFATMLSPRGKEGGYSNDGRRPERVVLDTALEPWLEHVLNRLEPVGVTAELL